MKKLPLGIQSFRKIVENDCIYVDKTQYIFNLINDSSYYFLSRPRRFGKSLLLDTIAEVFNGDRELFKGKWIYNSGYLFKKHPVIRFDMSNIANETSELLKYAISEDVAACAEKENIIMTGNEPGILFKRLIENLHKKYGERVVVLIDEYDKPILDHIDDIKTAAKNRQVLKGFYGILKSMDPYLRFTLFTGVTKFTKTSIFSGLNNLKDITMSEEYAGICGIPTDSLEAYFNDYITDLTKYDRFKKFDNIKNEILAWYDGYSWDGRTKLLNPFSLLSFFFDKKIGSYWYETGTPGFLIDMIKKKPESYLMLRKLRITELILNTFDIEKIEIEPLLFQAGYLTVFEVEETRGQPIYVLDIPNNEVRDAFGLQILSALTESGDVRAGQAQMEIGKALEAGDLHKMLRMMRGLFASIPYELHVDDEAYYHSIFYAAMTLLGFEMDAEVSVSKGRVDAILELDDKIYVMEFKYVKCPRNANDDLRKKLFKTALDKAMKQINDRGYGDKYEGSGKTVIKAAFAFLGRDDIEMTVES